MGDGEAMSSAAEQRRYEMIAAARQLFRERGIRRTTFGDVAERVGVTRGLVYHYFPTRDHLIDAAVEEFTAELLDALSQWDASRRPGRIRESLESAIALLRRQLLDSDPFAEDLGHPENMRAYAALLDRVVEAVVDQLETTTVRDYVIAHGLPIRHVRETFTVLLYGLIALLRARPGVPDEVLVDIAWQTLNLEEPTPETSSSPE